MKKLAFILLVIVIILASNDKWEWPVHGQVTQGYNENNHGLDIAVPEGTPVLASRAGVVEQVERSNIYGNAVMIRHDGGYETLYAHNSKVIAYIGEPVTAGAEIALSGSTGKSTGPHVHFEIRHNGQTLDPSELLK